MEERKNILGLILIFGLAILLRIILFFQNPSLFADETALAINVYNKTYFELFRGLDFLQASPVGFTSIVKFLLNLFNPKSYYFQDLVLRILPFCSGILALPAFYYLSKIIFSNNKKNILISLCVLFFNPCVIAYCMQFKQYSTEMLISIILSIIFYKVTEFKVFNWWYIFIIALSPWFSYSSCFILAVGLLALLVKKDWKNLIKISVPFFISFVIYYILSLKFVFADTYAAMRAIWELYYGFIDLFHPLRTLLRYGDLFANLKPLSALSGLIFFTVCFIYGCSKEALNKKILFLLPIILTIVASLMHKYAIQARLILFLMPLFAILIASIRGNVSKILKILLGVIMLFSMFNYDVEASGNCYSYSRDIIRYLEQNITPQDIILMDSTVNDYSLYLSKSRISNKRVFLQTACFKKNLAECKELIAKLPSGNYYLLSLSYYVKEITQNNGLEIKELDLGFKPKRTKAIYFIKEDNK